MAFNALPPPARKTYLQAALTPAAPAVHTPKRPPPLSLSDGCFRCLALDHQVRDCHDPVRCRTCHGSGHHEHRCSMLRGRMATPHPNHHRPTIPVPSGQVPVNPIPFAVTPNPPPSAPPTPPPTPLPHPPSSPRLSGSGAFRPKNMAASSSRLTRASSDTTSASSASLTFRDLFGVVEPDLNEVAWTDIHEVPRANCVRFQLPVGAWSPVPSALASPEHSNRQG